MPERLRAAPAASDAAASVKALVSISLSPPVRKCRSSPKPQPMRPPVHPLWFQVVATMRSNLQPADAASMALDPGTTLVLCSTSLLSLPPPPQRRRLAKCRPSRRGPVQLLSVVIRAECPWLQVLHHRFRRTSLRSLVRCRSSNQTPLVPALPCTVTTSQCPALRVFQCPLEWQIPQPAQVLGLASAHLLHRW